MSRKHNHRMATRQLRLHPLERQRLRWIWNGQAIEAHIHALTGEDAARAIEKTATLVYIALGGASLQNLDADHTDIRILRGTANTLGDCAGETSLTHAQRGSLAAGLGAVKRLVNVITEENLFHATKQMERLLGLRSLTLADFEALAKERR